MKARACYLCGDSGQILGSLPWLPVSAPLQMLPCPRCRGAAYTAKVTP